MLGPPQVRARLSKSAQRKQQRIQAAEVEAFTGSRCKRAKRSELALAIDGEGVNIYNVQTWALATSYAIPPQQSFTCPPCSVVAKLKDGSRVRVTLCALRGQRNELRCFSEKLRQGKTPEGVAIHSRILAGDENPVIFLTAVPTAKGADIALLALHRDGLLRCFSRDLDAEQWSIPLVNGSLSMAFAAVLSMEKARAGLLKDRSDLPPANDQGEALSIAQDPTVLMVIGAPSSPEGRNTGSAQSWTFILPEVPADNTESPVGLLSQPELLQLHPLQAPGNSAGLPSQYAFHKSSGKVLTVAGDIIEVQHAGSASPQASTIQGLSDNLVSAYWLSASTAAVTHERKIQLINVDYSVVLGSSVLAHEASVGKDKQVQNASEHLQLLAFFSNHGTIVGLCGQDIVTFDLAATTPGSKSAQDTIRRTLLADVIGKTTLASTQQPALAAKGTYPKAFGSLCQAEDEQSWKAFRKRISELSKAKDDDGFDLAVAELFDETSGPDSMAIESRDQHGHPKHRSAKHRQPQANSHKISLVLSKLFKAEPADADTAAAGPPQLSLWIRFLPGGAFRHLIAHGHLTQDEVARAVRRHRPELGAPLALAPGALVGALAAYDPSLHGLMALVASSAPLTVNETVAALGHALALHRRAQAALDAEDAGDGDDGDDDDVKRLTADDHRSSPSAASPSPAPVDDAPQTNGHPAASPSHSSPSPEPSLLPQTLHDAQALLQLCLARLPEPAAAGALAPALRAHLPAPATLQLVDYLRAELAGGGWLARHADPHPALRDASPALIAAAAATDDKGVDDEPSDGEPAAPSAPAPAPSLPPADHLAATARVLGAALDALGAGAWLGASGAAGGSQDGAGAVNAWAGSGGEEAPRLAHLRAEVSAALEGAEEAAYLEGVLREALLYAKRAAVTRADSSGGGGGSGGAPPALPTTTTSSAHANPSSAASKDTERPGPVRDGVGQARPVVLHGGDVDGLDGRGLLPLGLQPLGAGDARGPGGMKRSAREVGRRKSRRVGAYSFERIIV